MSQLSSTPTTPTPEQVAEAKVRLTVAVSNWPEPSPCIVQQADIRTTLSALATAESELTQCRETLRLKPSEGLAHAVTRLTLQVESAEADSKRLDWLEATERASGSVVFGYTTGADTWWCDVGSDMPGDGFIGYTLREAIDAASAHSPTHTQGGHMPDVEITDAAMAAVVRAAVDSAQAAGTGQTQKPAHYERLREAAYQVLNTKINDSTAVLAVLAVEECNALDELRDAMAGCGSKSTIQRSYKCGKSGLCYGCQNKRNAAIHRLLGSEIEGGY